MFRFLFLTIFIVFLFSCSNESEPEVIFEVSESCILCDWVDEARRGKKINTTTFCKSPDDINNNNTFLDSLVMGLVSLSLGTEEYCFYPNFGRERDLALENNFHCYKCINQGFLTRRCFSTEMERDAFFEAYTEAIEDNASMEKCVKGF